jgi:RNA polymerase sigma factor (sigma-70 family)
MEVFGTRAAAVDNRKRGRKEREPPPADAAFSALCESNLGRKVPARSLSGKDHVYGERASGRLWPHREDSWSMGDRESIRAVDVGLTASASLGARKRAAVELIRRHERTLRRTARRYSLCREDAEDALQRALEILLNKAPTSDQRELIRWMQTVTKHEALAVRRIRERNLGTPASQSRDDDSDWVQLIPSDNVGPADAAERQERIARVREALKTLKPQELRALTLLAQGYSYSEICEITGWTYTKVNRCLAEGRQRFRLVLTSIEEGRRCEELGAVLSAFVDGEAHSNSTPQLLAHLKECRHCRAKVRAFRAAPRAAAALAPAVPLGRPPWGRATDVLAALQSKLPGRGGTAETAINQLAATGGTKGGGMALAAKILTACVGTAGGAAACVAAGVVPPAYLGADHHALPRASRATARDAADLSKAEPTSADPAVQPVPDPPPPPAPASPEPVPADPATPAPPAQPSSEFSPEVSSPPATSASTSGAEFGAGSGGSGSSAGGGSPGAAGGEFGP